ncbi:Avirulence protein (Avh) [Phytophthora palmivora]|uniref:Avirulence protein (Avh) n=1 Tax=Phytophthora palmivora TaxID=4796 RepID=A0A2P4Y4N1_9STRA|nr:Avirulence protein (Avh) [Phytophthora palmivora]
MWGLVDQNDLPTQRFLRIYETAEDTEERVGGLDILTNLFKPGPSKLIDPTKLHDENAGIKLLKKFDFGDDIAAALKSSKLSSAIKTYNEKHTSKKVTLLGTLTVKFGDEDVAKALVTAQKDKNNPSLAELATTLRAEQFSTCYEVLNDYIKFYNREKSEHKTLLNTFTTAFGGEGNVVSIIAAAKSDPFFGPRARKIESDLLEKWSRDKNHPERIMNVLKLDDDVETVFRSDKLRTFDKYISKFNEKNSGSETSLLGMLTAKYGEVNVAKALVSAKRSQTTNSLATKLQMEQLQGWQKDGKSFDSVFALLKDNDKGLDTVFSRKLETLKAYIGLFAHEGAADAALIKTLSAGYGGEIEFVKKLQLARTNPVTHAKATELQNLLFKQWMDGGIVYIMMSTKELKRQASLDSRRRRNREAMQRARQRDKDHMDALRQEAQRLEDTHRNLLAQVDQTLSQISVSDSSSGHIVDLQRRLEDAREQANKLMRQNRSFQEQLGERVKGEDRMEGLLKELARDQQVQERIDSSYFDF